MRLFMNDEDIVLGSADYDLIERFKKFDRKSSKHFKDLFERIKTDREFLSEKIYDKDDAKLLDKDKIIKSTINCIANVTRSIVNSYTSNQFKWSFKDMADLTTAGIKFIDDPDSTTASLEALTNAVGTGLGVLVFSNDRDIDGTISPIMYSIPDVTNVRLDPNSHKLNASDANEAAIIELKSKKWIEENYGADYVREKPLVTVSQTYDEKEYQPLVTYYVKEKGVVTCYKLLGDDVVESIPTPYTYIPVIPVFGEQFWVDNKLSYCGITRQLKGIQKLINYTYRQLMLRISKAPKNTWTAPVDAIEGFEDDYKNADRTLNPVLPYNAYDTKSNPLTPPTRLPNEFEIADVSALLSQSIDMISNIVGIPAVGLETQVEKTATEVLMNSKTFNNNIRAYIQHLRYSLQVIGLLFAEQLYGQRLYGQIKIEMVEGPDEAMKKQEARVELQQMAGMLTSDEDKQKLMIALCAIEKDNEYIANFANSLMPKPSLNELQLTDQNNQMTQLMQQKDQQIIELQKQVEQLQLEQKMQAYSMDKEIELSKLKHAQEMEKLILQEKFKQDNPGEQAKTEAEVVKAQASIEKEALSLQKEQVKAAQPIQSQQYRGE